MRDPREEFETALMIERVVARTAGFGGWDPPEYGDEPDPSEMFEDAVRMFPKHVQKLLAPREKVDHGSGDLSVTLTGEAALSEDSGVELKATSARGEDADEDGPYSTSSDEVEYTLWVDHRTWDGSNERELKQHLREFSDYLEKHDPAGHATWSA